MAFVTNPNPRIPPTASPLDRSSGDPGFVRSMSTAWTLGFANQFLFDVESRVLNPPEEGFNPWPHMKGYEMYADRLALTRSRGEMEHMKRLIDYNLEEKRIAEAGGIIPQLAGELFNPVNYIPIPIARGIGFVKGAAIGAASNAGIAAVTDPIRIASDPTSNWNELYYSIGGAALFGGAIGGAAGAIGRRARLDVRMPPGSVDDGVRAFDRLAANLGAIEGENVGLRFNAGEEGFQLARGHTRTMTDGVYQPIVIERVDMPVRSKPGSDGQLYHYDDQFGWVLEADRGSSSPRAVPQEMLDELGLPERTSENIMKLDEAALRVDYDQGKHLEARGGKEPLRQGDIRTPAEYVTFRQIEAVYRHRTPMRPGEDRVAYDNLMQEKALAEVKASRADATVSRNRAFMPFLERGNLSPVASLIRRHKNDNVLTTLPLQIAGDYGWAIRANQFGYKTPPSLLLRAMKHTVKVAEIRQAIDQQWVKYVQRNQNATGMMFMGENVTATFEAMLARGKNLTGNRTLTRAQFSEMAGRAVFEPDTFTVDGFEVVPEAREAAKAWTRTAQFYDKEARDLGLFYDQRALEKTMKTAEERQLRLKRQIAAWLWGGQQGPSRLRPAVKVGDRIFSGESHEEAVMAAMDELGAETQITPDMYGYVPNLASANASDMIGALPQRDPPEWMRSAGGKEPAKPRFRVNDKDMAGAFYAFEYGSFADYVSDVPEPMRDGRIRDEASFVKIRRNEIRSVFDRSLTKVADALVADGMTLTGQQHRNGYNGVTYWDPLVREEFFLSAQAHEFLQKVPQDRLLLVQQTLDRIFPSRVDPKHDASLTSELTDFDPDPGVLSDYGMTEDQWRAAHAAGSRTMGRMKPFTAQNSLTGRYYAMSMIRVAVNQYYDADILDTAWHETLHALKRTGRFTPEEWQVLVDEAKARNWHEAFSDTGTRFQDEEAIAWAVGQWAQNPNDPRVAALPAPAKALMDRIIAFIRDLGRRIMGKPLSTEEKLTFEKIMGMIDSGEIGRRAPAEFNTEPELWLSATAQMSGGGPRFRTLDEVIDERVNSMSERQRQVYDDFRRDLTDVTESYNQAKSQLDLMRAAPHRFLNQYGQPEAFFGRYWTHTAIGEKREAFKRLLTAWYQRSNPVGAEERAEQTIDDMLKHGEADDERPANVPGLRHLAKRTLDIPNSFKINDPELGEIAVAGFINTDLEVVAEAYIRGMGHKIEAARMFGDADLWSVRHDVRQHWRDKYVIPAEQRGEDLRPIFAARDEYLAELDFIKRAVLGGLKTRSPLVWDNRIARNLKNYQVLTSMGSVLLTSIPEAMRIPMVNGFKATLGSLWLRIFADADKIKANREFSMLSGEMFDLISNVSSARFSELNTPDPGGNGKWFERLLEQSVHPFLKLVGQTHWTTILKDLTMFSAQHKVMDLALNLDAPGNAEKLAALGISTRDAALLASMPVERHGSIILPAVQNWAGGDGRRARTLLLDAIHAEARRTIVTPSISDKNLAFYGIAKFRGRKIMETDVMTLPLQFLSYSMAAWQKVLMSGLQGRDQNFWMGAFGMFLLGVFSNYLKQPQSATMNKSPEEWLIEGYEASGVGGFWFSDLNQMIEKYSAHQYGVRPTLGIDPRFGKTTDVGDYVDAAGPSAGTIYDVIRAFTDPDQSMTNKAQAIRRAVPYNNVIWWGGMTRDIATAAGRSAQ